MSPDGERCARVALSFLANPGDPVLGVALRTMTASELLAAMTASDADGQALLIGWVRDLSEAEFPAFQAVIRMVAIALEAVLPTEWMYSASLGSQHRNAHLHRHLDPCRQTSRTSSSSSSITR